jgi:hypothetical protein
MIYRNNWEERAAEAAMHGIALTARAREALATLDAFALEAIAEAAIGLLDERRDPDEDCCEAGDDGCGLVCLGDGRIGWGAWQDEPFEVAQTLDYAIDQRELPGLGWKVD